MQQAAQNIQNKKTKSYYTNLHQEYGIKKIQYNFCQKDRSKNRSPSNILIAKNKKLPQSFKIENKKQLLYLNNQRLRTDFQKPKLKLKQAKKHEEIISATNDNQYCFQSQNTSYFGGLVQPLEVKQKVPKDSIIQQKSEENQSKNIKLKINKSSSMKNIVKQRYFFKTQYVNQSSNKDIKTKKTSQYQTNYDSKKYNWKLSKSKSKQKSLSKFQTKIKLTNYLNKASLKKNNLPLQVSKEDPCEKSIQNPQIFHFVSQNHGNPKQYSKCAIQCSDQRQAKLVYTFSSDLFKRHNVL